MPNIKAADKWVLQSEKRRLRNLSAKTRLKTLVKKAREAGGQEAEAAAHSALDRAAGKGIIHPNKAARKKARLAKALRTAGQPATTQTGSRGQAARRKR